VISKSGNTVETMGAFFHLSPNLDPKGIVAITDPKQGELRSLAHREGWTSFPIAPNIGGRYSVLTAVGLLPSELGGVSANGLLQGAAQMRAYLESLPPEENPAFSFALASYFWDVEGNRAVQYLMPYHRNLKLIADWYVQLWAESLGKRTTSDPEVAVGFSPVAALGTTDQHSLLQLFKEGPGDKIIGFLEVEPKGSTPIGKPPFVVEKLSYLTDHTFEEITHLASLATEKSLNNSGVPTYRIVTEAPSPELLGALFFFFETACALAGELYGVDAFNQPGVEEAKRLLRESLG
jgi:glucose-6-phosphate isomerase